MLEWLKGRTECERKEKEIGQDNKREELEIRKLQHTEMLQVLQQTQQQISMQMKLSDQYMQQQAFQQQQQQTQLMANIFKNKE